MMQSQALRQYGDLSQKDVLAHPVWLCVHGVDEGKSWYAGTDELTYRPWDRPLPLNRSEPGMPSAVARTRFMLADGSSFFGFVTVPGANDQHAAVTQPRIFLSADASADLYHATESLASAALDLTLRLLHKSEGQVFPIRFDVPDQIVVPKLSGNLEGVYYYDGSQPKRVGML